MGSGTAENSPRGDKCEATGAWPLWRPWGGGVRGHLFLLQSVLTNGSVRAVREALGPTHEKSETRPQDFEFPVQPAGRQCGEGQAVPTGEPWRS